jgi:hypothetical protein
MQPQEIMPVSANEMNALSDEGVDSVYHGALKA